MQPEHPVIWLNLFTLVAGVVIAGAAFIYFLRARASRNAAARALLGETHHRDDAAPDGALPELIGVLLFAFGVMALLTLGYSSN